MFEIKRDESGGIAVRNDTGNEIDVSFTVIRLPGRGDNCTHHYRNFEQDRWIQICTVDLEDLDHVEVRFMKSGDVERWLSPYVLIPNGNQ